MTPGIKSQPEIEKMRRGGCILTEVMSEIKKRIRPGVSAAELDECAEKLIRKNNAVPSFYMYQGYPKSICVSLNNEVVHGLPLNSKILGGGDIVSIDLGVEYEGFHTDAAITTGCGKILPKHQKLIDITRRSLLASLKKVKENARVGDISYEIQKTLEENKYSVVRDCTGHGIGRRIHEDPNIPNFGKPNSGIVLKEGMTLAIEPMATEGDWPVKTLSDGWTIVTLDDSISAHFEYTVLVKKDGCEILTPVAI